MEIFKRMLRYSKPYWKLIAVSLIAAAGVAGTDAAIAFQVGPVLKKVFSDKDVDIFRLLPFAIVALFVFRGVCRFTQQYSISYAGQLGVQDIRNELYRKNM